MIKIQVFKVIRTSYRYGDENGITEKSFSTEQLMNQYFYDLYNTYKDNKSYHELSPPLTEKESLTCNQFEFNDGGKWSYEVFKEITELVIYESINELK
jgi:hypothetical protein